ncbi:MAG: FlgD immunoglobulin-like domain containing protein [bacterium]
MPVNRNSALGCIAAALVIVSAGIPGGASAQLSNTGFESPNASSGDVPGSAIWSTFNQVFTTRTTARSGAQSLKTFGPFVPGGGTGARQTAPALPGETWIGSVWAMNLSSDPLDNVDFGVYKIEFLDASLQLAAGGLAGVDIFESNPISALTPQNVWTELGVGTAPAPAGTAFARVVIVKVDVDGAQGGSIFWDDASLLNSSTGVPGADASRSFDLQQNAPNPFSPATRIGFSLSRPDNVDISVYDVSGRRVVTLLREWMDAGAHSVDWNGTTANGTVASAGVYYYVMRASGGQVSRSMMLMK